MSRAPLAALSLALAACAAEPEASQPAPADGLVDTAVEAGAGWLVRNQLPDGHWSDAEGGLHDVGATGLVLIALQDAGQAPGAQEAAEAWLMRQQDRQTGLIGEPRGHAFHYGHAIATRALCLRLAADPDDTALRTAAQRAVDYCLGARNPYAAWRYDNPPTGENDTSVTGWMLAALHAAEDAGLTVDPAAFEGGITWIEEVTEPETGRVGYDSVGSRSSRIMRVNDHVPPEAGEAMTAVGLAERARLGHTAEGDPAMVRHAELIRRTLPTWDPDGLESDLYYWYMATDAMASMGDEYWRPWRAALTDAVLTAQRADGELAGSWDPIGPWGYAAGRPYSTALMTSCLVAARGRSPR
jgi:hypothetical protein